MLSPRQEARAKKSHCRLESAAGPQLSYKHQNRSPPGCRFCGGGRYYQDCPTKNVIAGPWPQRSFLSRIFYEQNDKAEPEQKKSINSDEAELCSISTLAPMSNVVQLYVSMRYEATFLEKTIFKKRYVTDRNINLIDIDWVDELNLILFSFGNEAYQTLTFKPPNADNIVRGCNQYLRVVRIPHPSILI
ncbi:unnamed protein product [Hymenolepis diminuta]|uniref:CCHC-type domain-containing protein n=1 Tax=Hymenolepis diminuta TaxID=6216 RepID=A0A0R3SV29_HYMDI|nr:unnamed protein product [Hymenolepis diminuta]